MTRLVRMGVFLSLLGTLFIGTALMLGRQIVLEPEALQIDLQPDPRSDFMRWYLAEHRRGLRVDLTQTDACIRQVIPRHAPADLFRQCPWIGLDDQGIFMADAVTLSKCPLFE